MMEAYGGDTFLFLMLEAMRRDFSFPYDGGVWRRYFPFPYDGGDEEILSSSFLSEWYPRGAPSPLPESSPPLPGGAPSPPAVASPSA
ncbi:hypothetical protein NHX12_025945 [Muraenolepis orangiensis]|uniref:Uncharacterized protein n=1 Tax=Muraenolepis orangiensis TaxID=630683 RepID=A0A9Q0EFM8_9TELE|nr:hypothetical protein NHX12_025945 [Muraenolepis orangiensis]